MAPLIFLFLIKQIYAFLHIDFFWQVKYFMIKKLSDLKVGQSATILNCKFDVHLRRRMLEFGFLGGQVIKVLAISPLKNSFLLTINGYSLALRKDILQNIEVQING